MRLVVTDRDARLYAYGARERRAATSAIVVAITDAVDTVVRPPLCCGCGVGLALAFYARSARSQDGACGVGKPRTLVLVSVVEWPEQPGANVVPPAEALKRARLLPDADELAIEGLTVDEWQALMDALAEA